jgi:DNA-binding GntR family transcriptional regulator
MRILQTQGVVRTEPNRGSFISEFGSVETAELLEIRLSVERLALKRLMDRTAAEPEVIEEFEPQLQDMRRAAQLNEQLAYCQADLAFHNKLIELSQSPLLKPIWASLSRGVLVFLMQERDVAFDYEGSIQEHVILLDLIRGGRIVAVDREIERHIMGYMHQRARAPTSAEGAQRRQAAAGPGGGD